MELLEQAPRASAAPAAGESGVESAAAATSTSM
jgi:hypothetical protein